MASKQAPERHYVHFMCNGVTGFVEKEPSGALWVWFGSQRMLYECMQGKLKSTVHGVMVAHSLVSSWRG